MGTLQKELQQVQQMVDADFQEQNIVYGILGLASDNCLIYVVF